ncbi:MAG: D-Ala-D-Ala carboxypeptidase family metallohydrolase [Deltaproteobacteria bacterium]
MEIKLSTHFSLAEMIHSDYAVRNGFDNTPDVDEIAELRKLCNRMLEPIRDILGVPIRINSGFRSPAVNAGIGGAPTSQHQRGQAADFIVPGVSNRKIVDAIIQSRIEYDQLIYEGGESGWVHVSRSDAPRLVVLSADFSTGHAVYSPYDPSRA